MISTVLFLGVVSAASALLLSLATGAPNRKKLADPNHTSIIGSYKFDFEFVPLTDRTLRLYILDQPSYGNRSEDLVETHRYYDEKEKLHYVCIQNDLAPRTEEEAREWAHYWARKTSEYIANGQAFS